MTISSLDPLSLSYTCVFRPLNGLVRVLLDRSSVGLYVNVHDPKSNQPYLQPIASPRTRKPKVSSRNLVPSTACNALG